MPFKTLQIPNMHQPQHTHQRALCPLVFLSPLPLIYYYYYNGVSKGDFLTVNLWITVIFLGNCVKERSELSLCLSF